MAEKQRRQTFADDFQGEIDRVDGVPAGSGRHRQRQTFAGDFERAARRMSGRR
jgi:hypothetical protein